MTGNITVAPRHSPKGRAAQMTIGQVARRTGASIRTLRFYDRLGILSVRGRGTNNYRLFGDDAIECVDCIRRMQGAGLTLRQIQRVVQVERQRGDAHAALDDAYTEARRRLDTKIAELEAQRRALTARLEARRLDPP